MRFYLTTAKPTIRCSKNRILIIEKRVLVFWVKALARKLNHPEIIFLKLSKEGS
jgi:hypothetical protein